MSQQMTRDTCGPQECNQICQEDSVCSSYFSHDSVTFPDSPFIFGYETTKYNFLGRAGMRSLDVLG